MNNGKAEAVYLHDNISDPYQLENIAETKPDIIKELVKKELVPWLQCNGDPALSHYQAFLVS